LLAPLRAPLFLAPPDFFAPDLRALAALRLAPDFFAAPLRARLADFRGAGFLPPPA